MAAIHEDGTVTVTTRECAYCGLQGKVTLPNVEAHVRILKGELVQYVVPQLSADDREQLISGTHPKCWETMMGPDED